MSSKIYTLVELVRREKLSTGFERLVLGGEGLRDFSPDCAGGYIKFMFDRDHQPLQALPEGFPEVSPQDKPIVRSFTIAQFQKSGDEAQLYIDIAANKNGGIAANWVESVRPGETIQIQCPFKKQPLPESYDAYLLAGDSTAAPAIIVNLQAVDHDRPVLCVLDSSARDLDFSDIRKNIKIIFIDQENDNHHHLLEEIKLQAWPEGRVYVWAACEFEQMRALRRHFRIEKKIAKGDMYVSSYWKLGETDEGNKKAKKLDTEADI